MKGISGYQIERSLFVDHREELSLGYRSHDGEKVLIKSLTLDYPDPLDLRALRTEYEISRKLRVPGVLNPIAIDQSRGALIYEAFDGVPYEASAVFNPDTFLKFAEAVVSALLEIHQHGVVHQALKPMNLLYNEARGEVCLHGFAFSSLLEEVAERRGLDALLDSLAYLAPEQTGRMNRRVSVATDIYGLGITFYKALTGRLPFVSDDPMELVHQHLALQPTPILSVNPRVPEPLARIVQKMLHKSPEDRYRGFYGLACDLKKCHQRRVDGSIEPFTIGGDDLPQSLNISEKLYGRELEMDVAIRSFDRVCKGQTRFLLVSGPTGIGKTSFVHELRRNIAREHGFFVSGKSESTKLEIPYLPVIKAFKDLVHQVLAESVPVVEDWRQRLIEGLGPLCQVVTEVVPDLALLIGDMPDAPELEVGESKSRFRAALLKFLHIVASKEHPLVLFVDDLQWAGDSTIDLIRTVLTDPEMVHLMVISTVRDGEGLCWETLLKDLESASVATKSVALGPLDLLEVQELLNDSIGVPPRANRSLAELAFNRTQGNPLHVKLYLQSLYSKDLLSYVVREGTWNWDAALISSAPMVDTDVLALVNEKISKLSQNCLAVMQLGACIGTRFSLRMLSIAYQHSQSETASILNEAVEAGLLIPVGDTFVLTKLCDPEELEALAQDRLEVSFEFMHGRVQQAVYETMDVEVCKRKHLIVGQLFLKHSQTYESEEQVFEIVNQLNFGKDIIKNDDERIQLARLNLSAGTKARDAAAFSDAREYLEIARQLLPENIRHLDYELWFKVQLQFAEMAYYDGKTDSAETVFKYILEHATRRVDRALVYETRVLILINTSRLEDAVRVGLEGLALFEMALPSDPKALQKMTEAHRLKVETWLESHHQGRDILDLAQSSHEDHLHLVTLLMQITPAAFNTNQDLFRLITLLQVEQVIEHGHTRLSAYALATLGILEGMYGNYETGYELAQLSLDLNSKYPDPLIRNRLLYIGCNLVNHWRRHVRRDIATLVRVYRYADDNGDLAYANYSQLVISHHRWYLGESLLKALDEAEQYASYARQTNNQAAHLSHRFMAQAILNLRGLTGRRDSLDTVSFRADSCCDQLLKAGYFTGACICRIIEAEVYFIQDQNDACERALQLAEPLIHFCNNLIMYPLYFFLKALHSLRKIKEPVSDDEDLGDVEAILKQFEVWCHSCPQNFSHMHHFIQAEWARVHGQDSVAMRHYQEGIQDAKDQSYVKLEALGHDLATRFFLQRSYVPYGLYHIREALRAYGEWGALSRVDALRGDYSSILGQRVGYGDFAGAPISLESFDKVTLLKAVQAISSEIKIDSLLHKMMRFTVENAGAQRGMFIFFDGTRLVVEAEYQVDGGEVELDDELSLNSRDDLSKQVVHYVYRTRSDVLISDVGRDQQFLSDPYFENSQVRSVLCMPVQRTSNLLGILYLENHLARDTFTKERLSMLRLLSPQIAVSLENARFIANVEHLNESLQKEVSQRKRAVEALRKAQEIAVSNAHNAGKAEFANSVLHNINNVLNTVSLSCQSMSIAVAQTKRGNFERALDLIRKNQTNLATYLSEDKRGRLLPGYLTDLGDVLDEEWTNFKKELTVLEKHITLMKDIIETQQRHAKGVLGSEMVNPVQLMEDALGIQAQALARHKVQVIRDFKVDEAVHAKKAELTHILINLVKNAVEAMGFQEERVLTASTCRDEDDLMTLTVADTGTGITAEEMTRMFQHGFTTKDYGHGFGLAYCHKAMKEMGGKIEVFSDGRDKGARFVLTFAPDEV